MTATTYDRSALRRRWLHIGFGAFARAHPIFVLHRGLAAAGDGPRDWGVTVARLNSGQDGLDALDRAGGRYHVVEADGAGMTATEVGCVLGTLHPARDGPDALPDAIAAPALDVLSLTITEKGYTLRGDGLDRENPRVRADLRGDAPPATAAGVIVEGLARRRAAGAGGLTILACDNLAENGRKAQAAVAGFAAARDPALADWIAAHVRFPSAMVDRIVPAMTEASHDTVTAHLGAPDPNAVLCEPFLDWMIEDDFAAARPPLDRGGAIFVADARPFEAMKLRMLNGAHSFLALLGRQAGHATVDACMGDPVLARAVGHLMRHEAAPTLPELPGVDTGTYADRLLHRFANPRLQHRTEQIASDTSQKLPQRLLAPIAWHLEHRGRVPPLMALAVAAWPIWLLGRDDAGRPLPLNDPAAADLRARVAGLRTDADILAAILERREVFSAELAGDRRFRDALSTALARLRADGARRAVEGALDDGGTR